MCLPKAPDTPAISPSAVPALASASGLAIGGAARGAAQLGRLKLRTGATGSSTPASAVAPLSSSVGLPVAPASAGAGTAYQNVPNGDLRLPIVTP